MGTICQLSLHLALVEHLNCYCTERAPALGPWVENSWILEGRSNKTMRESDAKLGCSSCLSGTSINYLVGFAMRNLFPSISADR
jgi:hypothetical protein